MTIPRSARVLLASLLSLLAIATASAQDGGRTVKFRALCYEHLEGITSAKVVAGGGSEGVGEVALLSGNFSPEVQGTFKNDTAILFVDDAEAPNGRRVVAEGKLASGTQQVFLLLPSTSDKMPYRILAMNDDEKSFPMGGVRILNLCGAPVRFNLAGATMKPIPPDRVAVYPIVKAVDEWGMYQVRIEYATGDNRWIPVATPSWKGTDRKRDLVITALDPRTKQPRISYYKDIPPWRKAKLIVPE